MSFQFNKCTFKNTKLTMLNKYKIIQPFKARLLTVTGECSKWLSTS